MTLDPDIREGAEPSPERCLCGSPLSKSMPFFRVSAAVSVNRCGDCGQAFTCPLPYQTAEQCPSYFRRGEVHSDPRRVEEYLGYARLLFSLLDKKWMTHGKRLLDFGCGGGEGLLVGRELGMECTGVEINPHQREHLAAMGFQVVSTLDDLTGESFDVVILSHILEHLPDPEKSLEEMNGVLHRDSRLLISVPNIASWFAGRLGRYWPGLQPDQHLWHFTPPSLSCLLGRCGYRVERVEEHALGKGLGNDGEPRYGGARFLLDPRKEWLPRIGFFGLICLDYFTAGRIGKTLRMYGEHKGGDNLLALAAQARL